MSSRHARPGPMGWFNAKVAAVGSVALLAVGLATAFVSSASAADSAPVPAYLTDHLAACQADQVAANAEPAGQAALDDQAWAGRCVKLAQLDIDAWVAANPLPTPTTAPPTVPPTTPPATTAPPASPTAGPTTAPPTSPTAGIGTFAAGPSAGVGPATTPVKTLSGKVKANTTYDGYALTAANVGGTVSVSGLTLRNCTMTGGTIFTGSNIVIDHCRITGGISFSGAKTVTLNASEVRQWGGDAVHITSDSGPASNYIVTGNWLHDPGLKIPADCADHVDGFQLLGLAGGLFTGNVIDLGPWLSCGTGAGDGPLNGAFQIENTQGPVTAVTIRDNLMQGGGFIFRAYAGTKLDAVTGNGFGDVSQFGPFDTLQATITTFSGNYRVSTGQALTRA